MIIRVAKKTGYLIALLCVVLSCSRPIDLDQAKELELTPVMQTSLVYLNESASSFLENGSGVTVNQDFILVEFFSDSFIAERLDKVEFFFESKNSMKKGFELQIEFFDETSQLLNAFTVIQEASLDGSENVSDHLEVYENDKLELLKKTKAIVFTLRQVSGGPIDENTAGRIKLKSFGTFYLKISKT